ncbi:hypothetical protein EJ082_14080 [Brevundimonas diminuta]|jgi:hypothetical protein|uniref:Uncharacterized protein n=2 Tax=Caulobacteraceae TaxID=76892 RepID=A0A410NWB1_BREDI|nr:hypothetical protein [Brevundimonas diminuta]QAT14139.1 hypothetical protein EQG53_07055 [Brevundimonas diminuta]QQB88490.1 hypothetical protein I6H83_15380 [Brevundimonas diminuta]GEB99899.1 hypothetical protein BDI01nite_09640 [Brevundimonas diminuta]
MGMTRLFVLTLLLCAAPLSAQAQTWPGWPGPPPAGYDPHIARAEQHTQAMERLRLQADQREAEAARMRLQTSQTLQRLEAARSPAPATPPATAYAPRPTTLPAPATLTPPLDQTAPGVTEIDAWLSRPPH